MGIELLDQAMSQIISHPETWEQNQWFCGTKACLAGHVCLLAGAVPMHDDASGRYVDGDVIYQGEMRCVAGLARQLTGITHWEAVWLWYGGRTMPELYECVNRLTRDIAPQFWTPVYYTGDGAHYTDRTGAVQLAVHRRTTAVWSMGWWQHKVHPSRALAQQWAAETASRLYLYPRPADQCQETNA